MLSLKAPAQRAFPRADSSTYLSIKTVPPDFYVSRLSFFCRTERSLQRLTRKNLFIRLGSKQYVDFLEQKRN